jgi:spermidine synthase
MENSKHVKDGWFFETCSMWPGMGLSLEIEKVLYNEKSPFQHIEVFETKNHGKMLALDGIIQLTESDEFAYQEMLAHLPLFAHPHPETVLVIGGGDGGILREVSRHDCIKTIDFCEIDELVIKVSKQFLPDLACGFDDPRVNVFIGDGAAFVREKTGRYDVIIVDSSDPVGPGEVLFQQPFYESLKTALKPGGIIATQGESIFLHKEYVTSLARITRQLFKQQAYACIMVPTYPGGNIGICLGSLGPELTRPARKIPSAVQAQLKYYSPEIHTAAFALPYFAQKMLERL